MRHMPFRRKWTKYSSFVVVRVHKHGQLRKQLMSQKDNQANITSDSRTKYVFSVFSYETTSRILNNAFLDLQIFFFNCNLLNMKTNI